MPSKENKDNSTETKARESTAITLLLGENDELYYYLGMIDSTATYKDPDFLKVSDYTTEGLHKLLLEKNKGTYELIQELKEKKLKLEIDDAQFTAQVQDIQEKAMKDLKIAPTVMIKATEQSTYKNLVDALDEMLVCNIGAFAIVDIEAGDRYLLYQKTQNADYLTDAQRAQTAK